MNKLDEIAKGLGFMAKRTCEFNAFYYLVDENGFDKRNAKGEKLCVEIGFCHDGGGKNSLPRLWYQYGYTKEIMKDWWSVQTYVTNQEGACYRAYDPTIKPTFDRRFAIDFDWHLSATPENFKKLLEEVLRRFYS